MRLADFIIHPNSLAANLQAAHILALRVYSTAAFASLNGPLRDRERYERGDAHKLPVTVAFINEGVKRLRAVGKKGHVDVDLYRGIADRAVPPRFLEEGGTELAPLSTTTDLRYRRASPPHARTTLAPPFSLHPQPPTATLASGWLWPTHYPRRAGSASSCG